MNELKVFDIFFESEHDCKYNNTHILIVATEKQMIEEVIPFYENYFEVNTTRGKLYERKISYCNRDTICGWDKKDYKIVLQLNNK